VSEELAELVSQSDRAGVERLMERQRDRLKWMTRARLDPRLAARVDPSDLVQETLAEVVRQLPGYLRDRPLPFYPWLRQLATRHLTRAAEHGEFADELRKLFPAVRAMVDLGHDAGR
jgi:RNA polymerase sigma-70 factor (ECF subfamily)